MNTTPFKSLLLIPALLSFALAPGASAQRINLHFGGNAYANTVETTPATPSGPAGIWNNLTNTAACDSDVAVKNADGSLGPTLSFDAGTSGNWGNTSLALGARDFTAGVYNVADLYESGFQDANNGRTNGFRLKGLAPGTYRVYVVPFFRNLVQAGVKTDASRLYVGTGNATDARGAGNFALTTNAASPTVNLVTSNGTWVAATDGTTAYNHVVATVSIDSTNRWLTFLNEPPVSATGGDRPGWTVIQIEPSNGPPAPTLVPVITQALLVAQGLILRGTNGPASSPYQVLASTNLALPATNWPAISTNAFDGVGHFDSTNPVSSGLAKQFFRLLVGGALPPRPTAPNITNQPQSLTVGVGASASFLVGATGDAPLTYFWSFNTNTPVGGNSDLFTLLNVQTNNAGSYRVIVSNSVGVATSSVATLTVLSSPVITVQPQSQSVTVSNDATFTVTANGAAPLHYQWFFKTNSPVGGNSNAFTRLNAQTNDAGAYSVIITNNYGSVTSAFATLTISAPITNNARFNLVGFGQGTTGGGVIPETDPAYRKVYTPLQFCQAIYDVNKVNGVKVIEIMNDLDLGWKEIGAAAQAVGTLTDGSSVVKLHPKLLTTGVSGCYINPRISDADYVGLTIFSANGSAIRHCGLNVKATANIIIRNLKFDEYWEWDEQGKGQYDKNNWDFIVLSSGGGTVDHVWVDHCTFTMAYDGCADNKGGVSSVTYSWCKYAGDDGASNTNSFVRQQVNALEAVYQVNPATNAMYSFLRSHGFSVEDIVQVLQGSKKGTAVGETSLNPVNVNASVTFHHNWFNNMWDRHPRLAGGTVHMFNSYVYCTDVLAARRMRDARVAAMSPADQYTMENTYSFKPSINGSISTEDGAMLVEKSVYIDNNYPLRNNQTDPSNPIYTGKIKALDSIYQYDSTYFRGDSGDSTSDPGYTYFGPKQATIKPFSWNTNAATPNGQLPYTAPMDDPSNVPAIVTSPTSGAGAGVLTWAKTNWLKTSY